MNSPYNAPVRVPSDQGGSTRHDIPLFQEGIAVSKANTAYTFIPCNIVQPAHVQITPVLEGRSTGDIANGVALFTTLVGYYVSALAKSLLSAITDVDAWVASQTALKGMVVLNKDGDTAYVCIQDHTASSTDSEAGFQSDVDLGYWQELPSTTKFIKIIHTAAGSGDFAQFNYKIEGHD